MVMGMVCDKDTAAMFEAEVEHGATEHVTICHFEPKNKKSVCWNFHVIFGVSLFW